jgi:hypothetical protein
MSNKLTGSVKIRPLSEDDLDEADRIMRTAFGTFLGLADPMSFMGDADYVRTRWAAEPASALAAEVDGRLVGSNFVTRWGSWDFSVRSLLCRRCGIAGWPGRCSTPPWQFSTNGACHTEDSSRSATAPSTYSCTRTMGSCPGSSPRF